MDDLIWRDTYRQAKFWIFDAKIAFPILLTILHLTYWTVGLVVAFALLSYFLEIRMGMSLIAGYRALRSFCAGKTRMARSGNKKLMFIDYDRES